MKKIPYLYSIVFVSCISSVFCTDNENYSFKTKLFDEENIGKEIKYHIDRELSFNIPGTGYVKFVSSFNETIKYVGKKDEFYIIESTLTEINLENIIANVKIMDYYWMAMEGIPCHLYIYPSGSVHHVETVNDDHDYLLEAFEATFNGMFEKNYIYPFGIQGVDKKIGDSWDGIDSPSDNCCDSSRFYFTMDSPPSFAWIEKTNKLKKVKDKKGGRKIATVKESTTLKLDVNIKMRFMDEERFIKGRANGTLDGKWKWNIEGGGIISVRQVSNLQGDFEMDGETFVTKLSRNEYSKLLK